MKEKEKRKSEVKIHLAYRFHINFYHSYRGDSNDELGIGKDIRIIRSILDDLDALNRDGVPVMGTWDVENYYSLEKIIPEYAPDIIERMGKRVKAGLDEVEPMSWNNGIVAAHTAEEFDTVVRKTISNEQGSGLSDLFADWAPILRPQECMYTPSFLKLYPQAGIKTISTYYSSHPFNGFSNFTAPLSLKERYNPITLTSDSQEATMILLPCYNNGDVADRFLSLRHWVKKMRKQQLKMDEPRDLLLLIDMDADDDFWTGLNIPVFSRFFPSFNGLKAMTRSVADLPYLRFTTPGIYIKDHPPVGSITLNQDTADGSFDGLSSWAEKWDNTKLWSIISKSRKIANAASWLGGKREKGEPGTVQALLGKSLESRLLTLSTTHFGMASPVMNSDRLKEGFKMAADSCKYAEEALASLLSKDMKGVKTCLLPDSAADIGRGTLSYLDGNDSGQGPELILLDGTAYKERLVSKSELTGKPGKTKTSILLPGEKVKGTHCSVTLLDRGMVELEIDCRRIHRPDFPRTAVTYKGRTWNHRDGFINGTKLYTHPGGRQSIELSGSFSIAPGKDVQWLHRYHIHQGLPYIYVDVEVRYPETEHLSYDKPKARRLNTTWDARWSEVMPWEFAPSADESGDHWRIWKHNFFEDISSYSLNYGEFSENRNLDSFNNQITNGWVGVSKRPEGVLISQSSAMDNNFAFCPMRLRNGRLFMNPFGTYYGKQWKYGAGETGLGKMLSLGMADHLDSYAPSYNGRFSRFSLLLGHFDSGEKNGKSPDDLIRRDAMAFADSILEM